MLGNFCRTFPANNFRMVIFIPRQGVSRVDPAPSFATNLLRDAVFCYSALHPSSPFQVDVIPYSGCHSLFCVHWIHRKTDDFDPQSLYFAEAKK